MHRKSFYAINSITLYRLVAAPVLILLIVLGQNVAFAWMLALSFFTDLIDGYFARHFKVASIFGSKLDSVADDVTFLAAVIGAFAFKLDFILEHKIWVIILLGLYLSQVAFALIKYGKITSFHTYLGKSAALLQGLFFIVLFALSQPIYLLFYIASIVTILDLTEEIILIIVLPTWKANVKGLWWAFQKTSAADISRNGSGNKTKN